MKVDIQTAVQETSAKSFETNILITRHGPKDGLGGPLSEEGKQSVLKHYQSQQPHSPEAEIKVISSPISRAFETASIYKNVQDEMRSFSSADIELDERLSEKNLVEFIEQLQQDKKDEWFQEWFASELGRQAASDLSSWILEQLLAQQFRGGALKIHAFSHGPTMAAFILILEELSGENLISNIDDETNRLSISRLFSSENSAFNYLSALEISNRSDDPEKIMIKLQDRTVSIPISLLKTFEN